MRIIQSQVIKAIIIQAMVQSGVVMTGNADRIEAGAEAASWKKLRWTPAAATARGPWTNSLAHP